MRLAGLLSVSLVRHLENARLIAAIATAFTLPISTSGQAISVTVLAVLSIGLLIREPHRLSAIMQRPAAYLPVVLFALMVIGVTWSMLPLTDAMKWIGPYGKLLLIPLLMATGFTPRQVLYIGFGFLAGCLVIFALSYTSIIWPTGPWHFFVSPGLPVKDNAVQSEVFALCTFGLGVAAHWLWVRGQHSRAIAIAILAAAFFANMFFIVTSRTGLLVSISLLWLMLFRLLPWRRALTIALPLTLLVLAIITSLSGIQTRIKEVSKGIAVERAVKPTISIPGLVPNTNPSTSPSPIPNPAPSPIPNSVSDTASTSSRLDFWRKAWSFMKTAPVFGHGTGSIRPLYQSREATQPSPYGSATADPHNQFLHTTLQVGLIGGFVLLAMWVAHALLFVSRDAVGLFGLAVVWMNVLGSLFNSHISQVTQGMLYCVGIGLLGALVPASQPSRHKRAPWLLRARASRHEP